MNMNAEVINRLVLHPAAPQFAMNDWQALIGKLQEVGFLGPMIAATEKNRYFVGDGFLQMITLMGCSPHIEFSPPKNGSRRFCHIQFSEIYTDVQFRSASHNVFARCPQCRKRITNWQHAIGAWLQDPASAVCVCDKCGEELPPYELSWRHTAGFARMFIDILDIYPQEGVPVQRLLTILEESTGIPWIYFYSDR